jgi:DNA-binding MarR family transcriptional regulator
MPINVDDCIFFLLARASQAGTRFWTNCLADMNLTAVQAMVLNFLGHQDEVTSRQLSERTGLDGATLTGVLDRLEKSGMIQRQKHPNDRRAIHICLTPKGLNEPDRTALRHMLRSVRNTPAEP